MKVILFLSYLFAGILLGQQPWELSSTVKSEEQIEIEKNIKKLTDFLIEQQDTGRSPTKEESEIIDFLFQNEESSDYGVDAKSLALSTMVFVRDVEDWSKELPNLLSTDSKTLVGTAIDSINYVFSNGSNNDRIYLLENEIIEDLLQANLNKFNDENYAKKIKGTLDLMEKAKDDVKDFTYQPKKVSEGFAQTESSQKMSKVESKEAFEQQEEKENVVAPWLYWFLSFLVVGGIGMLVFNSRKGSSAS